MRAAFAQKREVKQDIKTTNQKYVVPPDPLEKEKRLFDMVPLQTEAAKKSLKILKKLHASAREGTEKNAILTRMSMMKMEGVDGRVVKEFVRDFSTWLLGRGKEEDHKKTPWGRQSLAFDPEVAEFVDGFVIKMKEYRLKLALIGQRVPVGINQAFLYFKFIVRGDPITDDTFLHDYDLLLREFGVARALAGQEARNHDTGEMAPYGQVRKDLARAVERDYGTERPMDLDVTPDASSEDVDSDAEGNLVLNDLAPGENGFAFTPETRAIAREEARELKHALQVENRRKLLEARSNVYVDPTAMELDEDTIAYYQQKEEEERNAEEEEQSGEMQIDPLTKEEKELKKGSEKARADAKKAAAKQAAEEEKKLGVEKMDESKTPEDKEMEKEKAKREKEAEKEAEKAAKEAEKQAKKEEEENGVKPMDESLSKEEKEIENEKLKAAKEAEKEAKKLEKEAEKKAKKEKKGKGKEEADAEESENDDGSAMVESEEETAPKKEPKKKPVPIVVPATVNQNFPTTNPDIQAKRTKRAVEELESGLEEDEKTIDAIEAKLQDETAELSPTEAQKLTSDIAAIRAKMDNLTDFRVLQGELTKAQAERDAAMRAIYDKAIEGNNLAHAQFVEQTRAHVDSLMTQLKTGYVEDAAAFKQQVDETLAQIRQVRESNPSLNLTESYSLAQQERTATFAANLVAEAEKKDGDFREGFQAAAQLEKERVEQENTEVQKRVRENPGELNSQSLPKQLKAVPPGEIVEIVDTLKKAEKRKKTTDEGKTGIEGEMTEIGDILKSAVPEKTQRVEQTTVVVDNQLQSLYQTQQAFVFSAVDLDSSHNNLTATRVTAQMGSQLPEAEVLYSQLASDESVVNTARDEVNAKKRELDEKEAEVAIADETRQKEFDATKTAAVVVLQLENQKIDLQAEQLPKEKKLRKEGEKALKQAKKERKAAPEEKKADALTKEAAAIQDKVTFDAQVVEIVAKRQDLLQKKIENTDALLTLARGKRAAVEPEVVEAPVEEVAAPKENKREREEEQPIPEKATEAEKEKEEEEAAPMEVADDSAQNAEQSDQDVVDIETAKDLLDEGIAVDDAAVMLQVIAEKRNVDVGDLKRQEGEEDGAYKLRIGQAIQKIEGKKRQKKEEEH